MIQRRSFSLTLVLAVLLGCGGTGDTKAQEKSGPDSTKPDGDAKPPARTDGKPAETPKASDVLKPGDKPGEDAHVYRATVTDRSTDVKDYVIAEAVIWVPEISILGGEGHTVEKKITIKRGAAEITVPFGDIAWIELGALKEDRLEVTVKRLSELNAKDEETRKKILTGTIKSNLQLAGKYEDTQLASRLKLREVKKIALEVDTTRADGTKPDAPKDGGAPKSDPPK